MRAPGFAVAYVAFVGYVRRTRSSDSHEQDTLNGVKHLSPLAGSSDKLEQDLHFGFQTLQNVSFSSEPRRPRQAKATSLLLLALNSVAMMLPSGSHRSSVPLRRAESRRARRYATARMTEQSEASEDQAESATSDPPNRRVVVMCEPTPFTYVSGYKNRFQAMIRHLVEKGDEVLVLTTGPDAPSSFAGAKVLQGWTFYNRFAPWVPETFALSPKTFRAVKEFKPDLIHTTTPSCICFTAKIYALALNVPYVCSYHTALDKYIAGYCGILTPTVGWIYRTSMRLIHRSADVVLATSSQALADLRRWGLAWCGYDKKRWWHSLPFLRPSRSRQELPEVLQVWSKGVDSDTFHPRFNDEDMRSKLTDGHPEDPLLVFVGRMAPEKNLKFFRDVTEKLQDTHGLANVRMAFVGDGPTVPELKEHFKGTKVVFTGELEGEELSKAYASADVFFMPSESETLGFVVLEAMAAGTPVVAVAAGGIPDIIQKDGEGAFLYSPGDVDAAAALVAPLLKDASFRESQAVKGRQKVSQWDWRAATDNLRIQYEDAIRLYRFKRRGRPLRRVCQAAKLWLLVKILPRIWQASKDPSRLLEGLKQASKALPFRGMRHGEVKA